MGIPLRQAARVGAYMFVNKVRRRDKYPLIVEMEPLFACNLECPGCGKIQHPTEVLRKRLSVEECVGAMEECGAPMVSIAGGEPLLHPQIGDIVGALTERKRFVYLCTNGVLLRRKMDQFKPSPYFSWAVHVDGLRERHDIAVARQGVFDEVVEAIREAKRRGFRVTTNSTFFDTDTPESVRGVLDFLNDDLGVDSLMVSPGYAYEKAPDQEHFLQVEQTRQLFRESLRRRAPEALAPQPLPAVPGLPRGQGRLPVHPVGDSQLLGVRLAAALLSHGRRLRGDLPGVARGRPTGTATGAAATSAAPAAWRTAVTSRRRSLPPPGRCASRCGHSWPAERRCGPQRRGTVPSTARPPSPRGLPGVASVTCAAATGSRQS